MSKISNKIGKKKTIAGKKNRWKKSKMNSALMEGEKETNQEGKGKETPR